MNTVTKIIESGWLHENGDTWLLLTSARLIMVDIPFPSNMNLDNQSATILGTMGIPAGSPFEKLIAEKIISHESIAKRAFEIYLDNHSTNAEENWFHAEKELLAI